MLIKNLLLCQNKASIKNKKTLLISLVVRPIEEKMKCKQKGVSTHKEEHNLKILDSNHTKFYLLII